MGENVTVVAVVGAQYGSEGKGAVVHSIANDFDCHVRVGGPNAGHSFWHEGKVWKMRSIPCGWTNPNATLVIGRGAVINPVELQTEIASVMEVDPTIRDRLFVDSGAWCISLDDVMTEHDLGMQKAIGSTQEGVGVARIARIRRNPKCDHQFGKVAAEYGLESMAHPSTMHLLHAIEDHGKILLEGTQGFGLSLYHGEWPYVTSEDTTANALLVATGLPRVHGVVLVARTYPIRVGGNSGYLRDEISWGAVSKHVGREVKEYTTVTQRVRRVGRWDEHMVQMARLANGATELAVTFMDYLFPENDNADRLSDAAERWVVELEHRHGIPVTFVGTGGPTFKVVKRGKAWWDL